MSKNNFENLKKKEQKRESLSENERYELGIGYYQAGNRDKAIENLEKADIIENSEAMFLLGILYCEHKKDSQEAERLLKRAGKKGHIKALEKLDEIADDYDAEIELAKHYLRQGDIEKAREYSEKARTSEGRKNDKQAKSVLRQIDFAEAQNEAGQGDPKAMAKLAKFLLTGDTLLNLEPDKKKAFDLLKEAAEKFQNDKSVLAAETHYELGMLYFKGDKEIGLSPNETLFEREMRISARAEYLDAMYKLGKFYSDEGLNGKDAKILLTKAAIRGHKKAKEELDENPRLKGQKISKWIYIPVFSLIIACSVFFSRILFMDKDYSHLILFEIIVLLLLFFTARFFIDFGKDENDWANMILGLGTMGTFLGIFLAMSAFEEVNDSAIKKMLVSLRFVFMTSVLGLGTSILLRFIRAKFVVSDISQDEYLNAVRHSMENVSYNISLIRNDWQEQTVAAIDKTFDRLGIIIEEKLNNSLTNSFGENFRKFDGAVDKILEYQKNHLKFSEIIEENKDMLCQQTEIIESLKPLMRNLCEEINKASASAPQIEALLKQYADALTKTHEKFSQYSKSILETMDLSSARQSDEIKAMNDLLEKINSAKDSAETSMKQIENDLSLSQQKLLTANENFETLYKNFVSDLNKNSASLEEALSVQSRNLLTMIEAAFNMGITKADKNDVS